MRLAHQFKEPRHHRLAALIARDGPHLGPPTITTLSIVASLPFIKDRPQTDTGRAPSNTLAVVFSVTQTYGGVLSHKPGRQPSLGLAGPSRNCGSNAPNDLVTNPTRGTNRRQNRISIP